MSNTDIGANSSGHFIDYNVCPAFLTSASYAIRDVNNGIVVR